MKFSSNCLGLKHDRNHKDVTSICCCFKKLIKLELKVEQSAHVRSFNKLPGGTERSSFSLEFDIETL
jgi:hypothetical protein